jgi:hypothetical protein
MSRLSPVLVATLLAGCGGQVIGIVDFEIRPENPRTGDDVRIRAIVRQWVDDFNLTASTPERTLTFTRADATEDMDPEVGRVYTVVLLAAETAKDQVWDLTATADVGRNILQGITSVTIANTPPSGTVALSPETPRRVDTLIANAAFTDADGDAFTLSYTWYVNNQPTGHTGPELPPGVVRRSDRVRVEVVANDGADDSPVAKAEADVRNSPPSVEVTLTPENPDTTKTLVALASGSDADGDELSFEFSWEVNGEQLTTTAAELPAQLHRRDDLVRVRAVARDGRTVSEPDWDEVTIVNSPPTAPQVAIPTRSGSVSSFADLLCDVVVPSTDGDRDPLTYSFTWWRNDVEWTGPTRTTHFPGDTIGFASTTDGDEWACSAVASDGTATSGVAMSDTVDIVPIVTYKIPVGQLVNLGSDCSSGGGHKYNGCSGNYGFYWNDTGSAAPRSITVEYNHGINCGTGSRTAFLNGSSIGTANTGDSDNCACEATSGTWKKSYDYTSMAGFRPGARNDFTMSFTSCEGFSPRSEWADGSTAIYAIVTVNY